MKTLHYTRSNILSKLHDELLDAIPSLRPIPDENGELTAVIRVEGKEDCIRITVPDGTDETTIAAVVAAHDPTPTPRPQAPTVEEQVATMKLALDALILGV